MALRVITMAIQVITMAIQVITFGDPGDHDAPIPAITLIRSR